MATALDLEAYLSRVNWQGSLLPNLETLTRLQEAHMRHIPFENLDVLLGRPISLDLGALQAKLIQARRGGYCFEHVTLLGAVLESLGFSLQAHTARVVMFVPLHEAPRTHMFLTVSLPEGLFVVDPGFGGAGPRYPLAMRKDQADDSHWMEQDSSCWRLKTRVRDEVRTLWITTLDPDYPVDFLMGNHYTATFPESPFRNRLMLRAWIPGGQVTVMNRECTFWQDSRLTRKTLENRQELRQLLMDHFGFDLPEVIQLHIPQVPEWHEGE